MGAASISNDRPDERVEQGDRRITAITASMTRSTSIPEP